MHYYSASATDSDRKHSLVDTINDQHKASIILENNTSALHNVPVLILYKDAARLIRYENADNTPTRLEDWNLCITCLSFKPFCKHKPVTFSRFFLLRPFSITLHCREANLKATSCPIPELAPKKVKQSFIAVRKNDMHGIQCHRGV